MTFNLNTAADSQGWVNLSERSADGITVTLDFRKLEGCDELRVCLHNARTGEDFTLYPENHNARDCFYHPYAFASRAISSGRLDRVAS
jgi:hypothetical protein